MKIARREDLRENSRNYSAKQHQLRVTIKTTTTSWFNTWFGIFKDRDNMTQEVGKLLCTLCILVFGSDVFVAPKRTKRPEKKKTHLHFSLVSSFLKRYNEAAVSPPLSPKVIKKWTPSHSFRYTFQKCNLSHPYKATHLFLFTTIYLR